MKLINIFYNVSGWPEHHNFSETHDGPKTPEQKKHEVVDKVPHNKKPHNGPSHKRQEIGNTTGKIDNKAWKHISSPEIAKKVEEANKVFENISSSILTWPAMVNVDKVVSDPETAKQLNNTLKKLDWKKSRSFEKSVLPEWKELENTLKKEPLSNVLEKHLNIKVKPEVMEKAKQLVIKENPELKHLPKEKLEALAKAKIVDQLIEKNKKIILEENPELKKLSPEKLKELASKRLVDDRVKTLEKKEENWKTVYENQLEKYKELKRFDSINPKLTKELISVYGPKLTASYAKLLKDVPKEQFPHSLEEFDAFMREKYAIKYAKERKGDAIADGEDGSDGKPLINGNDVSYEVAQNAYNADAVSNLASIWDYTARKNQFEHGNMDIPKNIEEQRKILQEVIEKLPEDSKIRKMLKDVEPLLWVNEKDGRIKDFLNSHKQNIDPAKTAWCRAFVNAALIDAQIPISSNSLYSREALTSMHNEVNNAKDLVPWDIVIVERNWKASDGKLPGGHIWFFLWMSKNGHPIILGWNQHNSLTIKEEKRPILWFRRAMSYEEANKIRKAMNWEKDKKVV